MKIPPNQFRWCAAFHDEKHHPHIHLMVWSADPRQGYLTEKAGTGCVSQINEKLWEGRYSPIWPDGKRHPRNVYAHSEEDCEKLLAAMIAETKAEIAAEKAQLKAS